MDKVGDFLGFAVLGFCFTTMAAGFLSIVGAWPNWPLAAGIGVPLGLAVVLLVVKFAKTESAKPWSGLQWAAALSVGFLLTFLGAHGIDLLFEGPEARVTSAFASVLGFAAGGLVILLFRWLRKRRKISSTPAEIPPT